MERKTTLSLVTITIALTILAATTIATSVQSASALGSPEEHSASQFAPGVEKQTDPQRDDNSAKEFAPGQRALGSPEESPSDLAPGHQLTR